MLLGYSAAELGRLVGNMDDTCILERRTPQSHMRVRPTYVTTLKTEDPAALTAARLLEQQTASSRIIEQRTQVVQTVD